MRYINKLNLPKNAACDHLDSPVGKLFIITSAEHIHAILWDKDLENEKNRQLIAQLPCVNHNLMAEAKKQLLEYFSKERKSFALPIVFNGTSFQNKAWTQLSEIPYGETLSYKEQARQLGNINKARAVGLANGANPISIVVPCHRVISSNGKLAGFGGGVDKKRYLLDLEKEG